MSGNNSVSEESRSANPEVEALERPFEDENDENDEEDEEIIKITQPIFDNPMALINLDADIPGFLRTKRISDVRILMCNFWMAILLL